MLNFHTASSGSFFSVTVYIVDVRRDVEPADDVQGEIPVDVTDADAVTELIEDNSVDFLSYISWDEVCYDLNSCVNASYTSI